MTSREQEYITNVRAYARMIWDAYHALQAAQSEWVALDYTNTLDDGTGANAEITKAQVSSVVNTTVDAIETLFGQGHATNIAKLL